MNWDSWRGSMDGRPTLWEKRLGSFAGRVIDVHKMVAKDDPDCFHTHPSYAIRIIVWGGYVEEVEGGSHRMWRPGMVGIVPPALSHRVAGLRNGRASYSIWIRLRKRAKVELRGDGWHQQEQIYRAPGTIFKADPGTVAVASAHSLHDARGSGEMTQLLPCPFCGSTNIDPEGWASTDRAGPACDDCAGTADTIELWNKRPVTREMVQAVKEAACFACGAYPFENCKRHPNAACGREFNGGSRSALSSQDRGTP